MAPLPFEPEYLFLGIVFIIGAVILVLHVIKSKKIFEKFNNKTKKPMFYMFYTEWCGHSKNMLPVWDSLLKQKVKRIKPVTPANDPLPETTLETIIEFKKINCEENEETQKMCGKFNIKFLPTLVFMKGDGTSEIYKGGPDLDKLFEFTEEQMLK